jgi:hypothetical protein
MFDPTLEPLLAIGELRRHAQTAPHGDNPRFVGDAVLFLSLGSIEAARLTHHADDLRVYDTVIAGARRDVVLRFVRLADRSWHWTASVERWFTPSPTEPRPESKAISGNENIRRALKALE